jgi:hypothetical protein
MTRAHPRMPGPGNDGDWTKAQVAADTASPDEPIEQHPESGDQDNWEGDNAGNWEDETGVWEGERPCP